MTKRQAGTLQPSSIDAHPATDHSAFFAAARAEIATSRDDRHMVVPRSFKAAGLAGLVIGCALAGFSVTGSASGMTAASPSPLASIAAALGAPTDALPAPTRLNLAPVMMLAGLLGGARVAALTVIGVHTALRWIEATSRTAYAIGGGLGSTALAVAMLVGFGHAPAHGWPIEIAAGAAAGFLYRIFAGVRPAA